jgi:hypothetical protein
MHHQMQQLGNLGLERLGFDGCVGGRHRIGSIDDGAENAGIAQKK